jgi:alcohol dehydrogenase class IV
VKQFYLPTRVITGLGCFAQLGETVRARGQRALLVCGQSSLQRSGTLRRALDQLQALGVHTVVYDGVQGEPTVAMVQEALNLARTGRAEVVVGIGGGSALDVGKAAAVLYRQDPERKVVEFHRGHPIEGPGIPFLSIPTTAGTGTEVTNNAVLTDPERGVKESIRGAYLSAAVAIVDPALTVSMPPEVTASSGGDALCQAIESFVGAGAQPASDALCGQAIEWIGRSLARAHEQGSDIGARSDMLYGSLLVGMAMTNTRLGGAHALAHPLGLGYHIPHGVVCGLLLPYVMEYSLEYGLEKYARVAHLLGIDTRNMSMGEAAHQAVAAVREIIRTIGLPRQLRTLGVKQEDFPMLVQGSLPSANLKNNARPLVAEDVQAILERAW